MDKIEFTISLSADNRDHLLLTAEYLKNLAGKEDLSPSEWAEKYKEVEKEKPVEAKKEKPVEAKKEEHIENPKQQMLIVKDKESTEQGITMEELRKKGKDLAIKSPEVKEKIKNWLIGKGFKSVPLIPKESYAAYNEFLDSL
jgi:hypothetical protein